MRSLPPIPRADDRRVVITGATQGIGLAAAVALTRVGADVAIVGRDRGRTEAAAARIAAHGRTPDIHLAHLDHLDEVRRLASEITERYPRVDVLLNNAGAVNQRRTLTADGLETTFAVNHLAPFLLTALLLDRLMASAPARVVTVSSVAHRGRTIDFDDLGSRRGYGPRGLGAYGRSKLANLLFTTELARRLEGTSVLAVALHPGVVATGFGHNDRGILSVLLRLGSPFLRTSEQGADTAAWLATAPSGELVAGGYYIDRRLVDPAPAARDRAAARRLWMESARLVELDPVLAG